MGIPPISFQLRDFTTPEGVAVVNDWIEKLTLAVNTLAGLHGTVVIASPIDMQGHPITNVGTSTEPSSVVTQQAAQQVFGPAAIQPQLDAMGNNILQTTRRLNDQSQREQFSTFLNDVLNLPPTSNTSTITSVAAGTNSTVTVAAGTYSWGDGSSIKYPQRIDTFANPGAGSNYYYYYLRKRDNTVQFVGPFTANTSSNQLNASLDGRGFIGTAQVTAAGGGTAGGGSDPPAQGGCLEVGTPFNIPHGKKWSMVVEPCDDWLDVELSDGRVLRSARGTQFSVFKKVQDLDAMVDELIDESGQTVLVLSVTENDKQSFKMKMTVEGRLYLGNGIWLSNWKPIS